MSDSKFKIPAWAEPFIGSILPDRETLIDHLSDHTTNVVVNAPRAMFIVDTKARFQALKALHGSGQIRSNVPPVRNEEGGRAFLKSNPKKNA